MSTSRRIALAAIILASMTATTSRIGQSRPAFQSSDTITLTCPSQSTPEGEPLIISANLNPADARLQLQWTVSPGKITDGQHTPAITVDTRGLGGHIISVTMELGANGCRRIYTCSTRVRNAER
jgi:hypothetical protein